MREPSTETLRKKKCLPCEGGVPTIEADEAVAYLKSTPGWTLSDDSKSISRKLVCKHFVEAIGFVNQIAELAEAEAHHPDLHLTGYRNLRIELMTHAIGGLSENDFILAAKIDQILE
ncbi:MAG: 4a-hydroxytetrahydrobiopterin dehydratase [Rubripirellula sp.]